MPDNLRKLLWFLAFWGLGITTLAIIALLIRAMIP